jgi:manganese/zinc/iron transport system permease protein
MLIYSLIPNLIILSIAIGFPIGFLSSYLVVRRWSLLGDIISHASLPGITYSFLFYKSNNTFYLLIGGILSSIVSVILSFILQKYKNLPKDSSFGLVLSWFFTFGMIGISILQKANVEGQYIINSFIFGNILTFPFKDIYWKIFICFFISILFLFSIKIQKMITFDPCFSSLRYKYSELWDCLLLVSGITIICLCLQIVGILLIGTLIISPGVIAKVLTNSYGKMILLSIFISILSFIGGVIISMRFTFLPTGPLIALIPILIAIFIAFKRYLKEK